MLHFTLSTDISHVHIFLDVMSLFCEKNPAASLISNLLILLLSSQTHTIRKFWQNVKC